MNTTELRALSMPLVRLAVRTGLKISVKGLTKEQENAIIDPIVEQLHAVSAPMVQTDMVPKEQHKLLLGKYRAVCKTVEAMRDAKLGRSNETKVGDGSVRELFESDPNINSV